MINKFFWGTVFLLIFFCAPSFAQKLSIYEDQKLLGYKDARGHIVIPARFMMAADFSKEGLAIVVDEKGWALIDRKGVVVIRTPFIFDDGPDDFAEGLARFTIGDKFGFYDKTGRTIIVPQFDFALPFQEGAAAVCTKCQKTKPDSDGHYSITGGRWGFIDRRGRVIVPLRFENAENFKNGKSLVKLNGKQLIINKRGRVIKQ